MKASITPLGLTLSSDGKISERPFLATLRETFKRDAAVLKVFDIRRPAHPCFGIDHATISGARDFTQGGISMGGCYKGGSLLSEQKHVTLCIGRYNDNGDGLAAMLGPKPDAGVVGIATEFQMLSDSGELDFQDGTSLPCEPVCCLDMAAWRGITRKRGKCAAICACNGLASLQSRPGADGIPDLPTGDTVEDFHTAQAIARDYGCSYGTAKMELPSLEAATHLLPEGWDFDRDGAWTCSRCQEAVYTAFGQEAAAMTALAGLRARAAHGDSAARKEAKAELEKKLKAQADLHGDAILLERLIMKNKSGTKPFIIDPMHCLELNLLKTLWKYAFGDRMTDMDRELVAEYLSSIGLHLDIRAKGKRDPGQKWFSAAQVDEFVLGWGHFKKSKSPGLVANILAILGIVLDKPTVADQLDAASAPAPKKPKTARNARHTAPAHGGMGQAEVVAAGISPPDTSHLSISELGVGWRVHT